MPAVPPDVRLWRPSRTGIPPAVPPPLGRRAQGLARRPRMAARDARGEAVAVATCAVGESAPGVRLEGPGGAFDLAAARGRSAVILYAMRAFN